MAATTATHGNDINRINTTLANALATKLNIVYDYLIGGKRQVFR